MHVAFALIVGLILGAITHIMTLIAIPAAAPNDAYHRLARLTPLGQPVLVDMNDPPTPFLDPNFVHVACLYDVSRGAVRVSVPVSKSYTAISLYAQDGVAFYAVNERSAQQGTLQVLLLSPSARTAPDNTLGIPTIVAPTTAGFALVRAMVPLPSMRADVEKALARTRCEPAG